MIGGIAAFGQNEIPDDEYFVKEKMTRYSDEEANIEWSKRTVRTMDMTMDGAMNFLFPEINLGDMELKDLILDRALLSKVKIYRAQYFKHEPPQLVELDGLDNLLMRHDTTEFFSPAADDYIMDVVEWNIIESVKKLRIIQDWYWDKKENKLLNKVVAIAPIAQEFNMDGNLLGEFVVLWLVYP